LLARLGVEFEVVAPEVEELAEGDPAEVVLENARRKARAGLGLVGEGVLVLGVDTDVALDGRLLGKASTEEEARDRLDALSGRTHEVLSGVVLLGLDALVSDSESKASIEAGAEAGADERAGVAHSYVTFRALDEATVAMYLRSGEWRDRAGAYAIQGLGAVLVEELRGDFSNVVGLPLALLLDLAPELGKSL
jgi:septum formation protein